jgi:hypothetical protein
MGNLHKIKLHKSWGHQFKYQREKYFVHMARNIYKENFIGHLPHMPSSFATIPNNLKVLSHNVVV